ncbi:MAG TPA: hypothetical protein VNU92_01485 [Edaphobacter sp.]|jgi:hypothetical protein|nr:hypothetical protein [Edaphobacter sp.]
MKIFAVLFILLAATIHGQIPKGYKGKPFRDATHTTGSQVIPGRLQTALYDLGGEGVAYHDTDKINHGSGELNHTAGHCEDGVSFSICHFREDEGVDLSYVKKGADLDHPGLFTPDWQQLYIGWEESGEWVNYTVNVKKNGRYKIVVLYSHTAQTIQFSLNNQPAADCKLPVDPWEVVPHTNEPDWKIYHTWNRAECGEITFPKRGMQLLTLHYKFGNNLAWFDFIPIKREKRK